MTRFNFIDAAGAGYKFLINEHRLIYHMALVPFLIKLAGFIIITAFHLDDNYLRQGLVLLPSYIVEGWLVAKLVRYAVTGELLINISSAKKRDARIAAMKASMIIYVLIKLALAFAAGSLSQMQGTIENAALVSQDQDPSVLSFMVAISAVLFLIWSFRLLWIYVPVALGCSVTGFLNRIKPFSSSLYMMGTWLLCVVPVVILILMISQLAAMALGVDVSGDLPVVYTYILVVLQSTFDLFMAIASSVAMAYGIASLYKKS